MTDERYNPNAVHVQSLREDWFRKSILRDNIPAKHAGEDLPPIHLEADIDGVIP